jgi:hypothetical protein
MATRLAISDSASSAIASQCYIQTEEIKTKLMSRSNDIFCMKEDKRCPVQPMKKV